MVSSLQENYDHLAFIYSLREVSSALLRLRQKHETRQKMKHLLDIPHDEMQTCDEYLNVFEHHVK